MYYTILNKLMFAQIKWLLEKPSYAQLTWVKTENNKDCQLLFCVIILVFDN